MVQRRIVVSTLLLTVLFVGSIHRCSARDEHNTTTKGLETDYLFRLEDTEGLKALYNKPNAINSVTLYVSESLHNFTIRIQSLKTDIATVEGGVTVSPCQHKANESLRVVILSTNSSSDQYAYMSEVNTTTSEEVVEKCYNLTFETHSVYLGYSTLEFYAEYTKDGEKQEVYVGKAILTSLKLKRPIDIIFQILVYCLVGLATLGMGNDLNFETIKAHLKKPKAPIIALVSQFTFMPLLSYSVIYIMGYKGGWAVGFFALGCSPGGGASNMYSKMLNGDMSLSITMTTISTIVSLGMIPFWLFTLGTAIPADEEVGEITIPFVSILTSLAVLLGPLLLGALIKVKLPRVSKLIRKSLKIFFFLIILFFFTVGIYSNLHIYQGFKAKMMFAGTLLPYGGYLCGGLLAWICRLEWKLIKTISLETGLQNVGVCILIIKSAMVEPDVDLAIIAPIAAMIMGTIPLLIITPIYLLRERILRKRKLLADAENDVEGEKLNDVSSSSSDSTKIGEEKETATSRVESVENENLITHEASSSLS